MISTKRPRISIGTLDDFGGPLGAPNVFESPSSKRPGISLAALNFEHVLTFLYLFFFVNDHLSQTESAHGVALLARDILNYILILSNFHYSLQTGTDTPKKDEETTKRPNNYLYNRPFGALNDFN